MKVRRAVLVFVLSVTLSAGVVAQSTTLLDIPAGKLNTALEVLARQSKVELIYSPAELEGVSTRGVHGTLTIAKAVAELLAGTDLTVTTHPSGALLIARKPTADSGPSQPKARQRPPRKAQLAERDRSSDRDEDTTPEIVVAGYRESLAQAQKLKRDAVIAEDVIVAEDIAAFPDLNLAESLQRIPGITIDRDSGEGRQITVRGLGPDFTRAQLNGMEVLGNTASGMDNRGGGVSRTRSFDYSLLASELFDRVTVQKSYEAAQDEGGIGGIVELSTVKPFDYAGFKAVLSSKGQTNSVTHTVTPRIVGLISDRWNNNFGVLASVAYSINDSNEFGYRNWGWSQIKVSPGNIGSGVSAADAAVLESGTIYAPQADTYSTWYDHRTRIGATLSLQYEPTDTLKLGFDNLFSRLTNDRSDYALAAAGVNALTGDVSGTQVLQSDVIRGNTLLAAQYTGVDMRSEFNTESDSSVFYQTVLHGSDQVTDSLLVNGLVGYSRSDYELPHFDKVFLESKGQAFGFNDRPSVRVNNYGFNPSDPTQWSLMRLDTQANSIVSAYTNAKLNVQYVFDSISTLKSGVEYKRFTNSGAQWNQKQFYDTPDRAIPGADKLVVPYDNLGPSYIVGDVNRTYGYIGQTRNIESNAYLSPGSNYDISEKTVAAYLEYQLNTKLWDGQLRANVGLRYYHTDLDATTSFEVGGALAPVSLTHHYAGVLPALNVAMYVLPDLVARFSANRDISRPTLASLAAAGTISTAPFGGFLRIGNPNLKPFTADSVDASLEFYEGHVGFVSVGAFYKKMNSFISSTTTTEPYSATGYPVSLLLPGQTGAIIYTVTEPVNVNGANIKGVEVAVQRDFDFLPEPLNHLGVVANGTYADGSSPATINNVSVRLPLVYLSKYSANATLYYETRHWGMRLSEAYRGRYLDGAGDYGNIGEGYQATNNVDFSAHYTINAHLKATLEGINLTNQHIVQFTDLAAKRIEVNTSSGRTILFGLTTEF